MANALQIKADVVNELRNKIYYGQIEIQRLVNAPAGLSHKDVVDAIVWQLRENLINGEAINLIESYIPTPQPQAPAAPSQIAAPVSEEEVGVKKID
jgi:hypothetical protein